MVDNITVHSTKFRHVQGEPEKEKQRDILYADQMLESPGLVANKHFIAIPVRGGGGPVQIVKSNNPVPVGSFKKITGNKGPTLDMKWCPHDDLYLATASEDASIRLWSMGSLDGLEQDLKDGDEIIKLGEHTKKVCFVDWHNAASGIIASCSYDRTIKTWDIFKGKLINSYKYEDFHFLSLQWQIEGKLIATTNKNKFLNIYDMRSNKPNVFSVESHEGSKNLKCAWTNENNLITTGWNKSNQRELKLWDMRNNAPLKTLTIDNQSGVLYPFFDIDTNMLYISGRGEGLIRYYDINSELDRGEIFYLNENKSMPAKAIGFTSKRACNPTKNEIARCQKISGRFMELIHFQVPKKMEGMDQTLQPNTLSTIASMTAEEWASGENKLPNKSEVTEEGVKEQEGLNIEKINDNKSKNKDNQTDELSLLKIEFEKINKLSKNLYSENDLLKNKIQNSIIERNNKQAIIKWHILELDDKKDKKQLLKLDIDNLEKDIQEMTDQVEKLNHSLETRK